jgi:hypothetical protein
MISQQTTDALDFLVVGALKSALPAACAEPGQVSILADAKVITGKKVVLLTMSTYVFRVVTLLYFTLDEPTKRYFAGINTTQAQGMSDSDYLDSICECANTFCGALNRKVARHFPHIGMSTPDVLDRNCVDYLHQLNAGYAKHFEVQVSDAFALYASVCVCDFAHLDFTVDQTRVEEAVGELELF